MAQQKMECSGLHANILITNHIIINTKEISNSYAFITEKETLSLSCTLFLHITQICVQRYVFHIRDPTGDPAGSRHAS